MTIRITKTRQRTHNPPAQTRAAPRPPAPPPSPKAALAASLEQNRPALILTGIAVASLLLVGTATVIKSSLFDTPDTPTASFAAVTPPETGIPSPAQTNAVQPAPAPVPHAITEQATTPRPAPVHTAPKLAIIDPATGAVKALGDADIKAIAQMLRPHVAPIQDGADKEVVTRLDGVPLSEVSASTPIVARTSCMDQLRIIAADSIVYFPPGSAALPPEAAEKIKAVGTSFAQCPNAVLHVTGHSDSSGDEQKNLTLSWDRADNTVAAMELMGFDTARIDPVGFGTRLPSAEGASNGEQDRRVEFHVLEMH